MYTIEVHYTTGNSFGSHDEVGEIPLSWESKELAREALKAIKEHYTLYSEREGYGSKRTNEQIYKDVKKHDWHTNLVYERDKNYWEYGLAVKLDDGSWHDISTGRWCGYFESLNEARIISETDDRDHISFW